jgi:hypothetical protein
MKVSWKDLAWPDTKVSKHLAEKIICVSKMCIVLTEEMVVLEFVRNANNVCMKLCIQFCAVCPARCRKQITVCSYLYAE